MNSNTVVRFAVIDVNGRGDAGKMRLDAGLTKALSSSLVMLRPTGWRAKGRIVGADFAFDYNVPLYENGTKLRGYVMVPGSTEPFIIDIQSPCDNGSGSPAPSCVDVPPESLPSTLNAVLSGSGVAACAAQSFTLAWDGYQFSSGVNTACPPNNSSVALTCSGGQYLLSAPTTFGGCPPGVGPLNPVSGSVSPFSLTFLIPACWFVDATGSESDTMVLTITA